ncbi:MAG: FKBP-type peptidyl-prolyl cis-trans isomerase, partial [Candidatus Poribacteria bacterium]|nr:FKBP-type peptidyl-prolyl cis-trans isomerase [Candidatus Poribacteria bacterium]
DDHDHDDHDHDDHDHDDHDHDDHDHDHDHAPSPNRYDDFPIELGAGRVLPEMEEGLRGANVGDTKVVTVTYPDDHPNEELRGKETTITMTVKKLAKKIVPELNDDFAKTLDQESVDALRNKYRENLMRWKSSRREDQQRRDLRDQLLEKVTFEVSEAAVADRLQQLLINELENMQSRGMNIRQVNAEEMAEELKPIAERITREQWILDEIADRESLEIGDDDIREYLRERIAESGQDLEKVEAQLRANEQWENYERIVRDEKIYAMLVERATQKVTVDAVEASE